MLFGFFQFWVGGVYFGDEVGYQFVEECVFVVEFVVVVDCVVYDLVQYVVVIFVVGNYVVDDQE